MYSLQEEMITLKKSDLAKFMALSGTTIVSIIKPDMSGKDFAETAKNSYERHMEGTYMEDVISGVGGEFDDSIKQMEEDNG